MKNLLAFLVLISHVNFSLFIPQADEVDQYDAMGRQVNDINSLYEYVNEIVLGNMPTASQDEDDDTGRYYHIVKVTSFCFSQNIISLKKPELAGFQKIIFFDCFTLKLPSIFFEIQSPPPETQKI